MALDGHCCQDSAEMYRAKLPWWSKTTSCLRGVPSTTAILIQHAVIYERYLVRNDKLDSTRCYILEMSGAERAMRQVPYCRKTGHASRGVPFGRPTNVNFEACLRLRDTVIGQQAKTRFGLRQTWLPGFRSDVSSESAMFVHNYIKIDETSRTKQQF